MIQSVELSRPEYYSGQPFPSPRDLPNPGIQPRSPPLQVDSLPAEPQGKPKNTGLGSWSLLQWIFPTQNWTRVSCMASRFLINWAIRSTITIFFLNIFLRHTSKYLMVMMLFWRRQWQPTPVLLPGKSHKRRSLVGRNPWGCEESDMTERLHFHFSLSCIGEGSGNPLQCSCLENPRDGGAWWAAVYGVAQSWTQLKWLSSSSMVLF